MRLWVLITHDHRCYLFKEGYIRTSSYKYTLESEMIENLAIHLTNNAIQKQDEAYGKLEDGNQLSYAQATVSNCTLTFCEGDYRSKFCRAGKRKNFTSNWTFFGEFTTENKQEQQTLLLWDTRLRFYGGLVFASLANRSQHKPLSRRVQLVIEIVSSKDVERCLQNNIGCNLSSLKRFYSFETSRWSSYGCQRALARFRKSVVRKV